MKAFDEYTSKFDKNNIMILRKYNHSYRVSNISKMLAQKLKLDESNIKLATLIGLLHDIGRFEQAKKFSTFSDIDSIDHGDFGAYLLFEEGLISKFTRDEENYDVIKVSVKGHNKYSIDKEYDEKTLLHLKIIRDADKIDILNIFANLTEYEFNCDGEVSKEVEKQFFNNQIVDNKYKNINANWAVGVVSFVFDINFIESFEYIKQEKFISKIYDRLESLEDKEKLKKYFEYAQNYIEKMLKDR